MSVMTKRTRCPNCSSHNIDFSGTHRTCKMCGHQWGTRIKPKEPPPKPAPLRATQFHDVCWISRQEAEPGLSQVVVVHIPSRIGTNEIPYQVICFGVIGVEPEEWEWWFPLPPVNQ